MKYAKYKLFFWLILVLIFFSEKNLFATVYYLSNNGNDSYSGVTSELAWKSLSKLNRQFLKSGDQILFKKGNFWNGTVKLNYSGRNGSPIIFGAWGDGVNPVISGFTTITGWTDEGGGIYSKALTAESNPEIVTINGVQYAKGRTPDSDRYNLSANDYYHIDSFSGTNSITDSECNSSITDWDGAEIVIRSSNFFDWSRCLITNHSGTTLVFANTYKNENAVGFGYFIQNHIKTLNKFGEWYYGNGKFYMFFGTAKPDNYTVKVSIYDKLIDVNTRNYITVKNLKFEGANLQAVGTDYASNASNLTVDNCEFDFNYTSIYGHTAPNMTVTNCKILRSSDKGIYNHWYCDGAYIAHNIIDSTALVIGVFEGEINVNSGDALVVSYSYHTYSKKNSIIEYNTVLNTGFRSISFGGDSAIARYNFIDKFCATFSDGGGLHKTGQSTFTNMKVDHNFVFNGLLHDDKLGIPVGTTNSRQYNIYLDWYDNPNPKYPYIISNNIVANTSGAGIYIHLAQDATIIGNTVYNCSTGIGFVENSGFGYSVRNITMNNNIVVAKNENDLCIWARSITYDFNQYGTINNNIYVKPNSDSNAFATLVNTWDETYRTFSDWKSYTKLDNGSSFVLIKQKEGEKERLFYNNTNKTINFNLGKSTFRDVKGENITSSFSLEPFSSKILIGKNIDEINQKPQISDQSFNIKSPLLKNDPIGTVTAYEPDKDQFLRYSISNGNDMKWFSIDSITGALYVQNDFFVIKELTIELEVVVQDNSVNQLSDSAKIFVHVEGTDTSPPEITSFSIAPNVNSYYIPVKSFSVIDDWGVKGYLLKNTPETPSINDNRWTNSIPTYFYVTQEGHTVIYAWALDFADNISNSASAIVNVTLPRLSNIFSEYHFEEENGNDIFDSKKLVNGTLKNNVIRGTGAAGKGLIFNGQGYVDLGKYYGENVLDQITISTWIKPDSINSNQPIITHGGFYSNTFELYINADSASILFITNGTSNTAFVVENINQLWDGSWHHLAVTYNGSTKTIFFDGKNIAEVPDSGVLNSGFWNNLYFGANISQNDSSFYIGEMDEVRIYNFALTEDEIGDLYHSVNKVLKKTETVENVSICNGENYLDWTESGLYTRVLQRKDLTASGADSIMITNLTVLPFYDTRISSSICEEDTFLFNNQKIFKSGTYSATLESTTGCDSVVNLKLKVNPKYLLTEEISILSGTNYLGWTTDGTYQRNLFSVNGCDSIVVTKLSVVQFFTHTIILEKGWNIFSTYLVPTNPNFRNILEKLEIQNTLISVHDESENSYQIEDTRWINGIGLLEESEGYKIKVNSGSELQISGLPVTLPFKISLKTGWNIISFPYQGKVNAMEVIQTLINDGILRKVLDEKGNSIEFWGNKIGWINGIGNFNTGEGYLLEVSNNGVLSISDGYKKSGLTISNNLETTHFMKIFEGNGYGHMNINITGLTDLQLEVGDELAAFDGTNCVGTVKLSNTNIANDIVSILASISDKDVINGYTEGNSIELFVWRSRTNKEFRPGLEVIRGTSVYKKYGSVFFLLDIKNGIDKNADLNYLNIYPNPASEVLNIIFQVKPEISTIIYLTDLTGKTVISREVSSNTEQLNLNSLPSGMYILKISLGKTSVTKKIIKR